jgi:tellurite resistance protein
MIPEFHHLTRQETELAYKAPILVSLLIAGADGNIDRKEIQGAIRYVEKKHRRSTTALAALLKEIGSDFEDKLKILMQEYPIEPIKRNALIVDELTRLNNLFLKLEPALASEFYQALLEIAEKTARSSGGFLGLNKIGAEEVRYVKLPMINPIRNS